MNDKEKPGQDAEVFVKAVKRKTRKYFNAEEKIRIVLEGMKRDVSVAELCRRQAFRGAGAAGGRSGIFPSPNPGRPRPQRPS